MTDTRPAPVVIIGAGLAAWTTVREFRKRDAATPVLVISRDSGDFYAKPSLSNVFGQKRGPEQWVTTPADKMAAAQSVELLAHHTVQSLDPQRKRLQVLAPDGRVLEQNYRQLVLATGAQPIRPPLQGGATERVHSINSLDDFRRFHADFTARLAGPGATGRVLVIGAGLIGCEFANDLALAGHQVQVVDPGSRPLASLLPEAASQGLQQALEALGVQWHWGTTVASVDPLSASGSTTDPLRVALADGRTIEADAVISAVGLRPDTRLALAAGLQCERGVVVDTQLRTSADAIFALGDGAQYASAGGRPLPYVMPIMQAAKVLADNLAGGSATLSFPLMPVAVKTPAWPLLVAPPPPGVDGQWQPEPDTPSGGAWRYRDAAQVQRGFVLAGSQTARRGEFSAATVA